MWVRAKKCNNPRSAFQPAGSLDSCGHSGTQVDGSSATFQVSKVTMPGGKRKEQKDKAREFLLSKWGRSCSPHFCSCYLIIREIQIKTIIWCYFTPIRMTDIRNELLSCSYLFLLSVRLCIYLEVNPMVINFLRNHHIVFNSGCTVFIFPLAQHQDSISPHPPTLVTVCLAALFTIAKG